MIARVVAEKDGSLTISLREGRVISSAPSGYLESIEQLFKSLEKNGCAKIAIPTGWRQPDDMCWVEVEAK